MAAITISRQFGSGGRKIAVRVSELLGWRLFDKRMMVHVAREVGLSENEIVDYTEDNYTVKSFWERLFRSGSSDVVAEVAAHTRGEGGQRTVSSIQLDEEWAVGLVNQTIRSAYEDGDVVIVGRGGQALLRGKTDVLHVRVVAPMNVRVQRLQGIEKLSPHEARELPPKRDKAVNEYMQRFFDVDPNDPHLYHMLLNTGKWELEAAAQLIAKAAKQLQTAQVAPAKAGT